VWSEAKGERQILYENGAQSAALLLPFLCWWCRAGGWWG
jgi:hypothetical protein